MGGGEGGGTPLYGLYMYRYGFLAVLVSILVTLATNRQARREGGCDGCARTPPPPADC